MRAEELGCNLCPQKPQCSYCKTDRVSQCATNTNFCLGYEAAMAEIEEKIAQVKKNGTWDGVDVDEYMKQFR